MLEDVDRLISSHGDLNHDGMGRRGLGHITRSGILTLCAAWELYLEEVLVESARFLIQRTDAPRDLPLPVQKELAKLVKEAKHELKPLELSGDGWELVYDHHATSSANSLNTPKSTRIDPLFERIIGIRGLSGVWSIGREQVDHFVRVRGDIAHRGRDAGYIRINDLEEYRAKIVSAVVDTDHAMADHIQKNSEGGSPWRRRLN
ncbi:HEPN domain-containing protein [Thiohalospira halophila]|uniref:HEPN domain-containing protein n=1 Tax=Thiohalospira halophila TaxID=381300 RepID=UPI0019670985|nr:HEPN domain-containing protein [Thiohalospira halophila]